MFFDCHLCQHYFPSSRLPLQLTNYTLVCHVWALTHFYFLKDNAKTLTQTRRRITAFKILIKKKVKEPRPTERNEYEILLAFQNKSTPIIVWWWWLPVYILHFLYFFLYIIISSTFIYKYIHPLKRQNILLHFIIHKSKRFLCVSHAINLHIKGSLYEWV